MFNESNAGGISWLLPIAAAGLLAGLWLTRRNRRTDLKRAGWLLWGGWALVSLATFSLSSGIFHQYYSIQVAPAVAALAGAGGLALWRLGTSHRWLRAALPVTILGTAAWAVVVLDRAPTFAPYLRTLIIIGAIGSSALLWFGGQIRHRGMVMAAGALAVATLLAGPTAYSLTTAAHPQTGSILTAGPSTSTSGIGGGFAGGGGPEASAADTALISYLEEHQGSAKYLVAAFGSGSSESIIIASGKPVITIGGFSGSDPAPTLAQFEALVKSGQVRYVLVGNTGGGGGPGGGNASVSSWVTANGTTVSYGGNSGTLYDLSAVASS
jgi:4-amino-4-deoxy-L-arabinose transferase-like glycosyltransferase